MLKIDLGKFKNIRWAKRKQHIPVLLTRDEATKVLSTLKKGTVQKLIVHLLYGCGMRLTEETQKLSGYADVSS